MRPTHYARYLLVSLLLSALFSNPGRAGPPAGERYLNDAELRLLLRDVYVREPSDGVSRDVRTEMFSADGSYARYHDIGQRGGNFSIQRGMVCPRTNGNERKACFRIFKARDGTTWKLVLPSRRRVRVEIYSVKG